MNRIILFSALFLSIYSFNAYGVDVSTWQGEIDWNALHGEIDYAIIRAGYGTGNEDKQYQRNYDNAKATGTPIGVYWYSYAYNADQAREEAYSLLPLLAGRQFEYPIYYDIEESDIFATGLTSEIAKAFCEVLEANKYYCGLYSSSSSFNAYFNDEVKTAYALWVAQWSSSEPSLNWGMWQYSDAGKKSGIDGNVDLDQCRVDYTTAIKETHLNGY